MIQSNRRPVTEATPTPPAKTAEEHHALLEQLVRLKLHFVHRWLASHPHESLETVLVERVDIWHKTHLNTGGLVSSIDANNDAWQAMVAQVKHIHAEHAQPARRDAFEAAAFDVFRDSIAARAPIDFERERAGEHLRHYTCGSLRFHKMDEAQSVFLHIANAIAPRSIFHSPQYLQDCLHQLLDLAEREYDATHLHTHTWLNSVPAWLAFFPAVWQARMTPPDRDVRDHYGFWGQFIDARGCFNHRRADRLRATGEFPYPPRRSWCTFDELRAHLENL